MWAPRFEMSGKTLLSGWSSQANPTDLQLQLTASGNRIILKMCLEGVLRNVNNVLYQEFQILQEG